MVIISVVSRVLQPLPIPGSHLLENGFNSLKWDSFSFLTFQFCTQFDAQIKNKLEAGASPQDGWSGPSVAGGIGPAPSGPRLPARELSAHKKIVDHYENPRNVGSLDKTSKNVVTALVGASACSDVMKSQIQVDEKGKIVDAKFKTSGCGSAIASSLLAGGVKGKTVEEALTIKKQRYRQGAVPPACATALLRAGRRRQGHLGWLQTENRRDQEEMSPGDALKVPQAASPSAMQTHRCWEALALQ